jgi:hypothetical protein
LWEAWRVRNLSLSSDSFLESLRQSYRIAWGEVTDPTSRSDCWATPAWLVSLFKWSFHLREELFANILNFHADLTPHALDPQLAMFGFRPEAYARAWAGRRLYANPPYSSAALYRFYDQVQEFMSSDHDGCLVAILPDRQEDPGIGIEEFRRLRGIPLFTFPKDSLWENARWCILHTGMTQLHTSGVPLCAAAPHAHPVYTPSAQYR